MIDRSIRPLHSYNRDPIEPPDCLYDDDLVDEEIEDITDYEALAEERAEARMDRDMSWWP
jgi:hypothetical protein